MTKVCSSLGLFAGICFAAGLAFAQGGAAPADAGTWNKDMSKYETLAKQARDLADAGKMKEAHAKTKALEKAWDRGTKDLRKANVALWKKIDHQMDVAIGAAKSGKKDKTLKELDTYLDYLKEAAQ